MTTRVYDELLDNGVIARTVITEDEIRYLILANGITVFTETLACGSRATPYQKKEAERLASLQAAAAERWSQSNKLSSGSTRGLLFSQS